MLLLLALQGLGMRMLEAVVTIFVATIGVCYGIEIFVLPQTQPSFLEMGRALINPNFHQSGMLVVAIGMIGATVMPHNLYLHSALVQSRKLQRDEPSIRSAIRFNTIDSSVALAVAFVVNAAILVLAALVFYGKDSVMVAGGQVVKFGPESDWIRIAHLTLAPLLGTTLASTLFAVALLASGQSSTITGTLAGQVVMEGFMRWRLRPWIRRMISRTIAIVPAIWIISIRGGGSVTDLRQPQPGDSLPDSAAGHVPAAPAQNQQEPAVGPLAHPPARGGEVQQREQRQRQYEAENHLAEVDQVGDAARAADADNPDRRHDGEHAGDHPPDPRAEAPAHEAFHHDLPGQRAGDGAALAAGQQRHGEERAGQGRPQQRRQRQVRDADPVAVGAELDHLRRPPRSRCLCRRTPSPPARGSPR